MSIAADNRVPGPVVGMMLFISSEVMFFGALFAAYATIRASARTWPPEGTPATEITLPLVLTAVLLSSSLTVHKAAHARDATNKRRWLAVTALLGALFLAGQLLEFSTLGFSIATNVFTSLFLTITGFHGLHVLAGVAAMLVVYARLSRSSDRGGAHAVAYYWHFVDAIWLLVLTVLYVLA